MTSHTGLRRPETRLTLSNRRLLEPPRTDRPGIRWWWQSPVPVAELIEELRAIAAAGFGEVEIAFSPGFWADDAQVEALTAVLREARVLDVGVAMTMGAAWPLQTPDTASGTPYAAQELQYGVTWVEAGSADGSTVSHRHRTTPVPPPFDDQQRRRPSRLLAVVAARVVQRGSGPREVPSGNPWGKPTRIAPSLTSTLLEEDSLTVLTPAVRGEGTSAVVSWAPGEGQWALMAFWVRDTEQGATSFLDGEATRAALSYLDSAQIGRARAELEREGTTATELFEDSLELNADCLFWAPEMLQRFTERHGYDLTPYLPVLMAHGQCHYWVPERPPVADFEVVDERGQVSGLGARIRADYDRLLTDLYVSEHVAVIQNWAVGHGMRHKAQAAYGQNLEAVRSFRELVRVGGRAEIESLNSGDRVPMRTDCPTWRFSVDWQRTCVSGAHQGGAVRVSSELGAQMGRCYDFSPCDYREMMDKEWALGATKPFVHGFASQDGQAPWPTQARFGTIVSESWNHRNFPQWWVWPALTTYWARGTAVLETGVPRTDVVIYRDGFLTTAARGDAQADATAPRLLFDAEPLERAGFNVGVIDPIGLAEAAVGPDSDGCLALMPEGPGYRALILEQEHLAADAAQALAEVASAGLPVVIVGPPPSHDQQWSGRDRDGEVQQALAQVLSCSTTARADSWAQVPRLLKDLGVDGRARWEGPALLSQVRDSRDGRTVLLYSPADHPVDFEVQFEGEGELAVIDLERGVVAPVGSRIVSGRTTVRVALAERGLVVLRMRAGGCSEIKAAPCERVRVAGGVVGLRVSCQDLAEPVATGLTLSWRRLVVDSTEPGCRRRLVLERQGPQDWRALPELAQISGTGTYIADVVSTGGQVPDPQQLEGLGLTLGEVAGVAVVRVGGTEVATVLRPGLVVPVGGVLAAEVRQGHPARLEIEVCTSLRNAALAAGVFEEGPWAIAHSSAAHGLIGPVSLTCAR